MKQSSAVAAVSRPPFFLFKNLRRYSVPKRIFSQLQSCGEPNAKARNVMNDVIHGRGGAFIARLGRRRSRGARKPSPLPWAGKASACPTAKIGVSTHAALG